MTRPESQIISNEQSVTCVDCGATAKVKEMVIIRQPLAENRPAYPLCKKCWDNIIGSAAMQALR